MTCGSRQKDPQQRMSSLELLIGAADLSFANSDHLQEFLILLQSHPFNNKFEDTDIDLGIFVSSFIYLVKLIALWKSK
ncbi:hypothetical protein IEQ34_015523 [Dendrobium chrysotoxum]|uniref:Uncharacterized protein n=1 Tax=Dendrobium chrysotoxum TaxID=161865 RepID=A0AAV7GG54_DENCH|nr:hypothetical protein IEQ34_015523 [Dendrobium chrysotoxum]